MIFDRKFIYLGGLGRPWNGLAPGLEPGRQKGAKQGETVVNFGGDFGNFLVFVRVYFSVFSGALVLHTLGGLGAQKLPKGRLWEVIFMTF